MNNNALIQQADNLVSIRIDRVKHPRLHQYNEDDATERMKAVIVMAHQYLGHHADNTQTQFMAREMVRCMMEENIYGLRNITFAEITYAIKKAMLSESEFFVTIPCLYKAVLAYAKGEGTMVNVQAYKQIQAERQKALAASAVGTMISAKVGQMITNQKTL